MKRTPLRRRGRLRARQPFPRTPLRRTPLSVASAAQCIAAARSACVVCGSRRRIDPAHMIPRSLGGCDDCLCVVVLCRSCHRAYDAGKLDLLPHLEPACRAQLARAVEHVGLVGAVRRISAHLADTYG